MAADYHDYFIKDGRHVGRYEEMYQNCPDPWRIEELGPRLDMRAALLLLAGRGRQINRFLDLGAGTGLFTGLLCQTLWAENPAARGLVTDIAPTAVAKASARLADPRLGFRPLNALALAGAGLAPASFDLAVLAQALWGLLDDLPGVLRAIHALVAPGGFLLISQHFPKNQGYGADVVAGPADVARHLAQAGFALGDTLETNRATNHHWAALAVRP